MKRFSRIDWGHYAAPTAMVVLTLSAVYDIVGYCVTIPFTVMIVFGPLTMILLVASLVALYLHARRLCEPCARSMPLDCANLAAKRRPHLHFMHVLDNNKKAYWAVIIVFIIGTWIFTGLAAVVLSVIFKMFGVEVIYGSVTHKKLQPWCPWCGERGVEVSTPVDTRSPVGSGV